MSNCAAFLRKKEECAVLLNEIKALLKNYPLRHRSLSEYFYDKDMLTSAKALLETIIGEMTLTGSRGGAVYFENGNIKEENLSYRQYLTITSDGQISFEKTKPVPEVNEPFEKYL